MTKKKHAWMIAWEASTPDRLAMIRCPRILAFIDPRRSRAALRDMVFAIYLSSNEIQPPGKLLFAFSPAERKRMIKEDFASVRCGFNPDVVARPVDDIEIEIIEDGNSIVRWKQPHYRQTDGLWHESGFSQMQETIAR